MDEINLFVHGGILSGKMLSIEYLDRARRLSIKNESTLDNINHAKSIVVEFDQKLPHLHQELKLFLCSGSVWDYDSLLELLLPLSAGMLFFFNIQKAANLERDGRMQWEHFLKNYSKYKKMPLQSFPIVICYNYHDFWEEMPEKCISPDELNGVVNIHNWPYFFTSSKTGKNVEAAYLCLIERIIYPELKDYS